MTATRIGLVATLLAFVACTLPAQDANPQAPKLPFMEAGLCPFEGCTYGRWTAMATVLAIANPPAPSFDPIPANQVTPVFVVNPGEVVTAVTGTYVTLVPGRARITKSTHAKPGDIVLTFSSSEGFHKAWFAGQWFTLEERTEGVIIDRPKSVWWAQIKNAREQIGWTDQAREFEGIDRLGGPYPDKYLLYRSFASLSRREWTELKPGIQIKPVVGETGTFTVAELEPGAQSFVHHHTQEQFNLAVEGDLGISIGGHLANLAPGTGAIVPPDAEHFVINNGTAKLTMLEFQPVRRFDLLPPRPQPSYPIGPQAVAVPEDQLRRVNFNVAGSDPGWTTTPDGVRSLTMRGAGAGVTIMDIPLTAKQLINLRPRPVAAEQFFYVLSGQVEVNSADQAQGLSVGELVLVPRATATLHLRLAPRSRTGARVLRFDPR